MSIHQITKAVVFEILSEMVESGEVQLGWNGDIKEFKIDILNNLPSGDYFCTLLYSDNGRNLSKSVFISSDRVMGRIRDKKLDNLGI
jgi:hypothetical protein